MSNRETKDAEVIEHARHVEAGETITSGDLIKWGAVLLAICTTLVSLVWFCATIKSDQALLHADIETIKRQVEERRTQLDKRQDAADLRLNTTDKTLAEVQRKLDVAVAILERIDGKVQQSKQP